MQTSHGGGFSYCRTLAVGSLDHSVWLAGFRAGAQQLWLTESPDS